MPKMISVNQMIRDLAAFNGDWKLTTWESEFIAAVARQSEDGKDTSKLSERELEIIDDMHRRHFRIYV